MKYISTILIDPQIGFCSPGGSLGLYRGSEELREIRKVIPNIRKALDESYRRHLVKSEYVVGQFTDGDTSHPLANLCVPRVNSDCDIIEELSSVDYNSFTTKHQQSALSSQAFLPEIQNDFEAGVRHFVITGFLLDHCVKITAEELSIALLGKGAEVYVCSDLSASRSEKYASGTITSTIETLSHAGIQFKAWQDIRP